MFDKHFDAFFNAVPRDGYSKESREAAAAARNFVARNRNSFTKGPTFEEYCGWDNNKHVHDDWISAPFGESARIAISPSGRYTIIVQNKEQWYTDGIYTLEKPCALSYPILPEDHKYWGSVSTRNLNLAKPDPFDLNDWDDD